MSGQTSFIATDQASLAAAISAIDLSGAASAPNTTYTITLPGGPDGAIALTSDLPAINLASGSTLILQGNGTTLQGNGQERGLFVYSGSVAIANLTISGTSAIGGAGGGGFIGGGGGAGLGGGLFVGSAGVVGLFGVTFANDAAIGGAGGGGFGYGLGGGGGLGGAGGAGAGLSGGGGIGRSAMGAGPGPAGAGIVPGVPPFGAGQYSVATAAGGGGYRTGGGVGAVNRYGGFGGGGAAYGSGGFGGGAGAFGRAGGFGGGGSGGVDGGPAGFGGGGGQGAGYIYRRIYGYYGSYVVKRPAPANGAGGLGAGGDVFVQQGGVINISAGALLSGTAVGGPAGGPGAGGGAGLADGLFIQGNQVVYLSPPTGQTLTIAGSIVDQSGSGLNRGVNDFGTLAVDGAGTVLLSAANSFGGGTVLGEGTLALAGSLAAGTGAIIFGPGSGASVLIESGNPANLFTDFGPGDAIVLAARPAAAAYDAALHQVFFTGGASLLFDPATAPAAFAYDPATGALTVACFAQGTRIATPEGEVAVEDLRAGDRVRLAEGGTAKIVWLGTRRIACRRHARPEDVFPVRVAAHAFGLNRPRRDVRLSPDHAVFCEDVLIPVRYLLNGATVRQERAAHVTYWHVELARHGVLLADGLPAESYLDTGNRAAFANGGVATMAHPDFARAAWAEGGCAELVTDGTVRDLVYRRLLAQALALGWRAADAGGGAARWLPPPQTTRRPGGMRAGSRQKLSGS